MAAILPLIGGYFITLSFGAGALLLFRTTLYHYNRISFEIKRAKWLRYYLLLITLNAILSVTASLLQINTLLKFSGLLALFFGMFHLMLLFTLPPVWLLFKLFPHKKREESTTEPVNSGRRAILRSLPFAVPLSGIIFQGCGLYQAQQQVEIYLKPLFFPDLPRGLDGLKILHISDLHLGFFIQLSELESVLKRAARHNPDLMVITGDFVDDQQLLPEALKLIKKYAPPRGIFFSPGNHEYYYDVPKILKQFKAAKIPALVNQHALLNINNTALQIMGLDDPQKLIGDASAFFEDGFKQGLGKGDFTIALSHRPRAFEVGVKYGIDLMLAGHTHGGQISAFSHLLKKARGRYIKGHHRLKNSQLFISTGAGNLFPFRVDCPREAPILILKKG